MRGLIIDYVGVLDGTDEDQRRWRNLLETVRQVGIPTAVLSNDPGGPAADPIRVLETQGIVDAVLLSGEIGAEKPSKEAFQAAADALDLPMRDCVMVDDKPENCDGAEVAGLSSILHTSNAQTMAAVQAWLEAAHA